MGITDVTLALTHGLIITQEHLQQMKGNKACGYVYMNPAHFIQLTVTNDAEDQRIMNECLPLEEYNEMARQGKNIIPPFLYVECQQPPLGKIKGHEGRHRAAACIKAGVKLFPVFLVAKFLGVAQWRLPKDAMSRFEFRYIDKADFPEYLIGEYRPMRHRLPLETWTPIYD